MLQDQNDQTAQQVSRLRAELSLQAERHEARIKALHEAIKNLQFEVVFATVVLLGMLYATRG